MFNPSLPKEPLKLPHFEFTSVDQILAISDGELRDRIEALRSVLVIDPVLANTMLG